MTVFNVCRNIRCHRHCNVAINTHDNGTADINIELINDSPSVQTCVASDEAQIGMRHYLDVDYATAPYITTMNLSVQKCRMMRALTIETNKKSF